jgi:tetratricopeptide (TPR) repeat protein
MANPRSAKDLAALYQESSGLIVFERTVAIVEAMFCGCPVIGCSSYGFRDFSTYNKDTFDIAWDFDLNAYERSKTTIPSIADFYDANERADIQALVVAIENIVTHFQLNELDALETTPAFALERAKQNIQKGMIKEAVITYRQLIIDHPSNVEAYYLMGCTLIKINLLELGLETLLQGQLYLEVLPNHECLNAVKVMYYEAIRVACHAIGDLGLSNQYLEKSMLYK